MDNNTFYFRDFIPLEDYANIWTNGLIAIKLDDGDELCWIKKTNGENDVIISTSADTYPWMRVYQIF